MKLSIKNPSRVRCALFVSVALAGTSLNAAAQNLIVNGGFEQHTAPYSETISLTNVPGWTSNFAYNELYLPGTSDIQGSGQTNGGWLWGPKVGVFNGLTDTSPAGGNFVAADADPKFNAYDRNISQTVHGLVAGQQYVLSFYSGAAQYTTASGPTKDWWQVSLGSEIQDTPTISLPSRGFSGWGLQTLTFTPTSTTEVLSFLAKGTPEGFPPVSLLDGVSLTAAVPEPGTYALLGIGLFGLAAFARRGRREASPA